MSKIYTFWSLKDGVGTTSLVSNIAYNIAKNNLDKKVLLLDFDMITPNIDFYLKQKDIKDLKDLKHYIFTKEINEEILKSFFKSYIYQPNFQFLNGLYDFNFFDKFSIEDFLMLLEIIKKMDYDYIFIDTNSSFFIDATFVALTNNTKTFIVLDSSNLSIRNINTYLEKTLYKIGLVDENIEFISNKFDSDIHDKSCICKLLNRKSIFFVDYNKTILKDTNNGELFIKSTNKKDKKIIEQINDICTYITNN